MRRIAAFVSIADGIRMASNYTKATCECFTFSRSGHPAREKMNHLKILDNRYHVNCKATLTLYYTNRNMEFVDHSDVCKKFVEPTLIAQSFFSSCRPLFETWSLFSNY